MPDFDEETGNTANLQGSEFYGHGNQFRSPNKNLFSSKSFLEQQQEKEEKDWKNDADDSSQVVIPSGGGGPVTCDAYGNPAQRKRRWG